MKTNIAKISLLTMLAAAIVAIPVASRAQDTGATASTNSAPVKAKKAGLTFHGATTAVDTNAMTITVGEKTYNITSKTKITKAGQPAVLGDITVGETVRGAYKKGADGNLDATRINIGATKKKNAATSAN